MILNRENVQKLIEHYETAPEVLGWGYSECIAGALVKLGITRSTRDAEVAQALGIMQVDADKLISGPAPYVGLSSAKVVRTLKHLLKTDHAEWQH